MESRFECQGNPKIKLQGCGLHNPEILQSQNPHATGKRILLKGLEIVHERLFIEPGSPWENGYCDRDSRTMSAGRTDAAPPRVSARVSARHASRVSRTQPQVTRNGSVYCAVAS